MNRHGSGRQRIEVKAFAGGVRFSIEQMSIQLGDEFGVAESAKPAGKPGELANGKDGGKISS